MEQSIYLVFADLKIIFDKAEASLEELEVLVPLAPATHTFLGLQEDVVRLVPPEEDVNSKPEIEFKQEKFM